MVLISWTGKHADPAKRLSRKAPTGLAGYYAVARQASFRDDGEHAG